MFVHPKQILSIKYAVRTILTIYSSKSRNTVAPVGIINLCTSPVVQTNTWQTLTDHCNSEKVQLSLLITRFIFQATLATSLIHHLAERENYHSLRQVDSIDWEAITSSYTLMSIVFRSKQVKHTIPWKHRFPWWTNVCGFLRYLLPPNLPPPRTLKAIIFLVCIKIIQIS